MLACFVARTKKREVEGVGIPRFFQKVFKGEDPLREALQKQGRAINLVSKTLAVCQN
jgi:hypothetical protein